MRHFPLLTPALAFTLALTNALVAAFGGQCNAHRKSDFGVLCPTPLVAHLPKACAVTPAQRKIVASYYDRTSLHHRAQVHYAFPHDVDGDSMLAIFLDKPVSGTPNSYEVLNPPDSQTDGLVYERCGNLVHAGAPFGI